MIITDRKLDKDGSIRGRNVVNTSFNKSLSMRHQQTIGMNQVSQSVDRGNEQSTGHTSRFERVLRRQCAFPSDFT